MAHFAKLDENNRVIAVHVLNNEVILDNEVESEQKGIAFLSDLHGHSNWKQTSYNGSFRGRYAGIGDTYDASLDAFIPEKPYPSWVLNTSSYVWESPVPHPIDGKLYNWSEEQGQWIEVPANGAK